MRPQDRQLTAEVGDLAVIRQAWPRFGDDALLEIRRLPGRSHRVYECVAGRGPSLIARLAQPRGARFEVEAAVIRHCEAHGIAVPTIRHVGIERTVAGPGDLDGEVAVMVQEKATGETLSGWARRWGGNAAAAAVANAGEALAGIHQVLTRGFGPLDAGLRGRAAGLGSWFVGGLGRQLADARLVHRDAGPILDQAMGLLIAHRAFLDGCQPGLLHGDFSPDNVLVDDEGNITAIVDWEAAKSGPPELDVGWWDCFFDSPLTPASQLVEGYERRAVFDPSRSATLRHLTVLRIMIGHFSWTLAAGDRSGVKRAAERLAREVDSADIWGSAT